MINCHWETVLNIEAILQNIGSSPDNPFSATLSCGFTYQIIKLVCGERPRDILSLIYFQKVRSE